ncbi:MULTISPECIES: acetyl-CoA C-acyltransferase [unclassified Dietzia]|uniref:acetyl-CoA C-acyltransferase n=1 Tax=unclassified Dietzia TaxID=2617939 RepID=UPI0015FD2FAF|nr:thiolase family protein [Dietzia sp. Cai40]MBB1045132.1 thiolase family protein [Dietzia sp. DQ11-44]MBB1052883.1 thiolase family protein [Dietzia sp. B44]MBC7296144.1 thiolase family protein [Dietzia sp.]
MHNAVIIDAVRSPMGKGKPGGALADLHPVDLLAQLLSGLVDRTGLDTALVDDVIVGVVSQVGEQSGTVGRQAALAAGFPQHVPGVTVERKCGSSQQAVDFAVQGVVAGAYDVVIAAGLESMSRIPMGVNRLDQDPHGPLVHARYPNLTNQGVAAELVAGKWDLSREQLDEYSARSHDRADAARSSGWFDEEIVPVTTPAGLVDRDESIRPGTTAERLADLRTAFDTEAARAERPEIDWKVTAGNSSQITDGAAAMLIMNEDVARSLGLTPIARIVASAVVADDPVLMLTGPIPATRKVLDRAGMTIADLDTYEVNEAFASVPLAWRDEMGADDDKLNPVGGAVALGHPLGASGVRIMTTMIHHLRRTGGRFGLQTMCEAGGMANATVVEAL